GWSTDATQRGLMPLQEPLGRLAQILEQMKTIRNLNRIRSATGRTIDIVQCAVAADDLDAGMLLEPAGQAGCRAVGQQVNWLMLLQINQERSIMLAFAKGKIVDAQDPWCRVGGCRDATNQSQEGARTDRHTLAPSRPRGSFSPLIECQLS